MANPPPAPPPSLGSPAGASCLSGFAAHLRAEISPTGTIDARAGLNEQYVVVHIYLIPGDTSRRLPFRNSIATELAKVNAIQLHDLAYAVPSWQTGGREVAEQVWMQLIFAGAQGGEHGRDAWQQGDVVYVHYATADGMCVLAGSPGEGQRLPNNPR